MEFLKFILPWIISLIVVVAGYVRLQSQVKNNKERIKEHHDLLTSGNGGGAPFITEPEHGKMQDNCRTEIFKEISNISKEMGEMKETMKMGDECRSEAREENNAQLLAMRKDNLTFQKEMKDSVKEMFTTINPLVTRTALNELELEHLKEKVSKESRG